MSRRLVVRGATVGAVALGAAILDGTALGNEPKAPKLWTLEGELKVHPKYIYRYYLVFGDGQKCALYGSDHGRDPERLKRLDAPVRVRVSGALGTAHHAGGTKENPSPFGPTWVMYMDVHEVEVLK
ncbi:hypothetical protein [Gemmata massiliana]|uniref:hypothetical protein n=1 Tax=Gemmata massiliana TaxID=1210884 RepID=UPI0013A6B797|nr:hypothetical protein [Gemmata massiliana]